MNRKHPKLQPGIRIQYTDKDGATRTERIHSRRGNTITVTNALKEKRRVKLSHITGYWPPRVKANPRNLIPIRKAGAEKPLAGT